VGSNGEQVRNFYLPKGGLAMPTERLTASLFPAYWLARMERRRLRFRNWPLITSGGVAWSWELARSIPHANKDLGTALAEFYTTQRVRHFIGNGLALYSAVGAPRAPFLDGAVVAAFRGLGRSQQRRDRFHVGAIRKLVPELAEIPFNASPSGKIRHVGYSPFHEVLRLPKTLEVVMDCARLDDLVPRQQREAVFRMADRSCAALLLTLAFAGHVSASRGLRTESNAL
jgi:hypothetical protein